MNDILVNLNMVHGTLRLCDDTVNQIGSVDELSLDTIHQYGSALALATKLLGDAIIELEKYKWHKKEINV